MALTNQVAFGHMIPKYALAEIDTEIIRQCVERTLELVDSVILDWKGIRGEHKSKIITVLETLGLVSEKV
jgi:D-tyrosyl-tRNA(Tyr) deacylase